jgi:hypothetical protein
VDLQAGASPSAQVEEQQPAHLQIEFVWEQERAVPFCAGGGAATCAHHLQIWFVWEQQRAEGKLFSFCSCTSDLVSKHFSFSANLNNLIIVVILSS